MTKKEIAYIMNILRKGSIGSESRKLALIGARRKVIEDKNKKKFYWKCASCSTWFREVTDVEVDHIEEIGAFTGSWDKFINDLFCAPNNLQVLCVSCHKKKTARFNASRLYRRDVGEGSNV